MHGIALAAYQKLNFSSLLQVVEICADTLNALISRLLVIQVIHSNYYTVHYNVSVSLDFLLRGTEPEDTFTISF